MAKFLDIISERPLSQKIGLWVGSLIVIAVLFWNYVYYPMQSKLSELETKVDNLTTNINQEKRLIRDLGKFREEVKQLDVKLKVVLRELPDKKEIPDLLDSISNLAKDSGLEIVSFRPESEVFRDFYAEVPVLISVEGTFHQVASFFDDVARMDRIVNISKLTLRDPLVKPDRINLKADCAATTFRYLDEAERAASLGSDQDIKRKRRG